MYSIEGIVSDRQSAVTTVQCSVIGRAGGQDTDCNVESMKLSTTAVMISVPLLLMLLLMMMMMVMMGLASATTTTPRPPAAVTGNLSETTSTLPGAVVNAIRSEVTAPVRLVLGTILN